MYKPREQDAILKTLQKNSKLPTSKMEGTFENDVLATNSIEFSKIEVEIAKAYEEAYADTSHGRYLTMRAKEFGVDRKEAQKAKGEVTVIGTGEVLIGSYFQTPKGIIFRATKTVQVKNKGQIPIEAEEIGKKGNVKKGEIKEIPINIPGITSVTNEQPTHDGYDEESDEDLRKRYYQVVRTPATSGNVYHYYNWAMSVKGVGDCRVLPLWNGNGTVKVVIIDSNRKTASEGLKEKVRAYIEKVRPIGATVTIDSPEPFPIIITGKIKGVLDKENFIKRMNTYLGGRSLDLKTLSTAQVINILLDDEIILDCEEILINGKEKIEIGIDKLPFIKEVNMLALS